ncbi:MAG: type VI secretion system tube protein Hcp [Hyphomicrobiales bacterium]|nr:MAG: type VI secretion system tube protein Hcp [Hyphomicrobiales bacterium]
MAASDFYVKAKGVDGESAMEGHEKEIEITSWSWNVHNESSAQSGGGSGTGKAIPGALHFSCAYGRQSPNLAQRCASGTHLDELKLTGRKAGGKQEDYITITLEHVFITSVEFSGVKSGEVSESVNCSYKKIKFEYKVQDSAGKLSAGPEFKWDTDKGKAEN